MIEPLVPPFTSFPSDTRIFFGPESLRGRDFLPGKELLTQVRQIDRLGRWILNQYRNAPEFALGRGVRLMSAKHVFPPCWKGMTGESCVAIMPLKPGPLLPKSGFLDGGDF
jgi:hypothetical protein